MIIYDSDAMRATIMQMGRIPPETKVNIQFEARGVSIWGPNHSALATRIIEVAKMLSPYDNGDINVAAATCLSLRAAGRGLEVLVATYSKEKIKQKTLRIAVDIFHLKVDAIWRSVEAHHIFTEPGERRNYYMRDGIKEVPFRNVAAPPNRNIYRRLLSLDSVREQEIITGLGNAVITAFAREMAEQVNSMEFSSAILEPPTNDVGERLNTINYRRGTKIASGAVKKVYRGVAYQVHTAVAIQTITAEAKKDSAKLRSFLKEGMIAEGLRGKPGIMEVYDFGTDAIVAELLADGELGNQKNLSEAMLTQYLYQFAHGILSVHLSGQVHFDVKLANFFVENGYGKLGDFGLTGHPETFSGWSPGYEAPEISREGCVWPITDAVDVWAFGICIQKMLKKGDTGPLSWLACCCLQEYPLDRPMMHEVVQCLGQLLPAEQ